jgi:hypothetical protein
MQVACVAYVQGVRGRPSALTDVGRDRSVHGGGTRPRPRARQRVVKGAGMRALPAAASCQPTAERPQRPSPPPRPTPLARVSWPCCRVALFPREMVAFRPPKNHPGGAWTKCGPPARLPSANDPRSTSRPGSRHCRADRGVNDQSPTPSNRAAARQSAAPHSAAARSALGAYIGFPQSTLFIRGLQGPIPAGGQQQIMQATGNAGCARMAVRQAPLAPRLPIVRRTAPAAVPRSGPASRCAPPPPPPPPPPAATLALGRGLPPGAARIGSPGPAADGNPQPARLRRTPTPPLAPRLARPQPDQPSQPAQRPTVACEAGGAAVSGACRRPTSASGPGGAGCGCSKGGGVCRQAAPQRQQPPPPAGQRG